MTSAVPEGLKSGQWFWINEDRVSVFRVGREEGLEDAEEGKKSTAYAVLGYEMRTPLDQSDAANPNEARIVCEKGKLVWNGNKGILQIQTPEKGIRKTVVRRMELVLPEDAEECEKGYQSTRWYYGITHFFGCFANRQSKAQ